MGNNFFLLPLPRESWVCVGARACVRVCACVHACVRVCARVRACVPHVGILVVGAPGHLRSGTMSPSSVHPLPLAQPLHIVHCQDLLNK